MRTLSNYIDEAIKIGASASNISVYTCHPKSREDLDDILYERVSKEGPECDLNDIDVSEITDMSWLFYNTDFNGDISRWNVSNIRNMAHMFYMSRFNQDISRWDVSNVKDMTGMFSWSKFNGDISNWDVSNLEVAVFMFGRSTFNRDISNWKINKNCDTKNMFHNCPIKEEFKPILPQKK